MSAFSGVQNLLDNCDLDYNPGDFVLKMLVYGIGVGVLFGLLFYNYGEQTAVLTGAFCFACFELLVFGILVVTASKRVSMMENALPDFLTLMSSNIKSGLTPDRALLLSSRKEFGPLAKEIDRAAKETVGGAPFTAAFFGMVSKINSEMFAKTVRLIVEGVRSGGELSELLQVTSIDMRRFETIRKEVAATVAVYRIFIFAACAIGAPMLYASSIFLVNLMYNIRQEMSASASSDFKTPLFNFSSSGSIDPQLVFWFSVVSIFMTTFLGALAAGVIAKGKESDGFTYIPPLLLLAYGVFFATDFLLNTLLGGLFVM